MSHQGRGGPPRQPGYPQGTQPPQTGTVVPHLRAKDEEESDDEVDKRLIDHENKMEVLNTRINQLSDEIQAIKANQAQTNDNLARLLTEMQAGFAGLKSSLNTPNPTSPVPSVSFEVPKIKLTTEEVVNNALTKELTKKASQIPESFKLVGTENYDQWFQALSIMFRAIGLPGFISDPSVADSWDDKAQAVLLSLLRDSLTEGPQALIAWETKPTKAFKALKNQYSIAPDIQRGYLYHEFHSLSYSGFEGSITEFNAKFNGLLAKLVLTKVEIEPVDQINRYLNALEGVFPVWTERIRSNIRQFQAIGQQISGINLQWLMADITEEQRNPASSAARNMLNHTKKLAKARKNKSTNSNEGFRPHYKKPKDSEEDNNSNPSNSKPKGDKKGKKGAENNANNANSEDYACVLDYSLNLEDDIEVLLSNSECSSPETSSSEPDDSDADSEGSDSELEAHNLKKASKNPTKPKNLYKDGLLYDTGATVHIVNSRRWFKDYKPVKSLNPIYTGGGPVKPLGVGTAVFTVVSGYKPTKYTTLTLKNALYLPTFDLNIFSGVRHYKSGGYLIKSTLVGSHKKPIGLINFQKHQFFLQIQGQTLPNTTHYINRVNTSLYSPNWSYNSLARPKEELIIELEAPSKEVRDSYIPISEELDIEPQGAKENPIKGTIKGFIKPNNPTKPWKNTDVLEGFKSLESSDSEEPSTPDPTNYTEGYKRLLEKALL